ncbi:MAG: putative S-layer associated protein, partial [Firmicutes bacterium]|nr:putative S-layer associated protein [Bacillota bacterium]
MQLDGQSVAPTWDAAGLITYTPESALAAGPHSVHLSVSVSTGTAGSWYDPAVSDFTFTVSPGAVAAFPEPGPEELRALDLVNGYRRAVGLAPLTYVANLGAAALSHARYLVANPGQRALNAHGEQEGKTFFTGATGGDRARYFDYVSGSREVINFTDRAEVALEGWMATLYHRIPLIHPGTREMGYGLAGSGEQRVNVLEAGISGETPGTVASPDPGQTPGAVAWPYPGQTGVPTGWDGAETPDPLALYPASEKPVGYTITLTFGDGPSALSLRTGTLTGPEGAVPVFRFDPVLDAHLTDTVALIPRQPLRPGTTYTVAMAGSVTLASAAVPFERHWSFTTAATEHPVMQERVSNSDADGTIERITVDGSGFGPGLKLFLAGLPVENLAVDSRTSLAFRAPAGYAGGVADLVAVSPDGSERVWPDFFAADAQVHAPDIRSPFTQAPLLINGRPWAAPALIHRSGAVLVPADLLEAFGGRRVAVPEIGRDYWRVHATTLDYTLGRTAATLGGKPLSLAVPVRSSGGHTYVDAGLLAQATGMGVQPAGDHVDFGLLDVAGHWARPEILQLVDAGVIAGTGDGRFQPDATLSRAAFVKMLIGSRTLTPEPGVSGGLADIARHWVAEQGYIGAALRAGIVLASEYPGGRFEPDRPITREEMAVMITRALGAQAQAALWGGEQEPGGAFTYRPARNATRAEAAVMLSRSMKQP